MFLQIRQQLLALVNEIEENLPSLKNEVMHKTSDISYVPSPKKDLRLQKYLGMTRGRHFHKMRITKKQSL